MDARTSTRPEVWVNQFEGKTLLVTGGSRGIGRTVALNAANQGARVVVNYAAKREAAEQVVREIFSSRGEAVAIRADISKPGEPPGQRNLPIFSKSRATSPSPAANKVSLLGKLVSRSQP